MPKPDMSLTVNVDITGQLNGNVLTVSQKSYSQGASNPASTNVVSSDGNIDLTQMTDPGNQYNNQTDITFMLSGTITDNSGNSYTAQFPNNVSQAISLQKQNGGAPTAGEFVPSLQSSTALFLDDANSDGQDYTYCLTVEPNMISADGIPTCPLDPTIVNR
jgi:hypothetical protein